MAVEAQYIAAFSPRENMSFGRTKAQARAPSAP